MADWNAPALTTAYTTALPNLKDRDLDVAKMMDSATVTVTNPVTSMKRWNDTNSYWEEYNGTSWVALVSKYMIDVDTVDGFHAGNASGNVPVSNGTVNTNLNADMVDGSHAGTAANNVLKLDGSGLVPQANIPSDIPWTKIINEPTTVSGYGITDALTTAGGTMTSGNLALFQDPSSNLHAATKQYVDNSLRAVDFKASCRVATTTNITLSAPQTIDGIAVVANDRVLVKNQTTASQNGIYVCAAGAWARAVDADTWDEHVAGVVFVEVGTTNGDTGWLCTVDAGGTLGTTNVTFTQIAGTGTVTAGTGIAVNGYQVALGTSNVLSLFNLAANGLVARTAANTVAARSLAAPAAGLTITNSDAVAGNPTFALANDLGALEALASTGIAVRTTTDTWAQRSIAQPAAGLTITNPAGLAGDPTFALANDLSAVEGLAGTGLAVRTAADTWTNRSVAGTANEITVSNGDGVAGNPTLSIPAAVTFTGKTITGGTYSSPTINTPAITGATLSLNDTDSLFNLTVQSTSTLTADRILTVDVNDAARTLTISGTAILSGTNTGDQTITLTGDVTGTGTGSFAATIAADAVTDTKLRNSAALSVIGRSAGTAGDPADISTTASSNAVLRESAGAIGWGTLGTNNIANDAVTYAKIQNVSATDRLLGRSTAGAGDIEEITCTSLGRAKLALASEKRAVFIPATAMTPRSANGCAPLATTNGAANQPDIPYLAFDGTADEFAGFYMQMPKSWNESTVTARFQWRRASGTGAANVVWAIRGVAVSDNDTPAATFGTAATVTDDAKTTTANFALSAETGACTIGGTPAQDDLVFFEVFRDPDNASDTLTAVDAWLTGVTLFITLNQADDA
jgi:hypothetical protein